MKSKFKIIIITLVGLFDIVQSSYGQIKNAEFKGLVINGDEDKISSLFVRYQKQPGFSVQSSDLILVKPILDSINHFTFKIPELNKPCRIELIGYSEDQRMIFRKYYFCEPGDNIDMQLYLKGVFGDSVAFRGRGAEKYTLINNIQLQEDKYRRDLNKINLPETIAAEDSLDLTYKLTGFLTLLEQNQNRRNDLINEGNFNSKIKMLIKQEFCLYDKEWFFRMGLIYKVNKEHKKLVADFYKCKNKFLAFTPTNDLSSLSLGYVQLLGAALKTDLLISNNENAEVDLKLYYDTIKRTFSGNIRDILLGRLALGWAEQTDLAPYEPALWDSLMRDAVATIQLPYIKTRVNDMLTRDSGKKVVNAQFVDLNGKLFDIESLKGKVVLLDVWFRGCSGCQLFHKIFDSEVYPFLRDKKEFVFLSVNIDRKRENWVKGIKSNVYSSKEYINVTTEKVLDHPFMKHYKVTGAPFLMLIDKNGVIVSARSSYLAQNMKYLYHLIKTSLKSASSK